VCHEHQLDALSEDEAIQRCEEDADHIWAIEMSVGFCPCCEKKGPLGRTLSAVYGDARTTLHTLYFTPKEVSLMFKGVTPGAVTTGFGASINAGGHLATLRQFTTFNTVVELALLEIFPFVAACLTHERQYVDGCWGSCCGFTRPNSIVRRYPVSIKLEDGSKVDRYYVGSNTEIEQDGEAIYDAVTALGLDGDVKCCYDPHADQTADPLAVKFGASPFEPIFWANTVYNGKLAIDERIVKPEVPMTIDEDQEKELIAIVNAFVTKFRNSKLVPEILMALLFIDYKSKKWTEARAIKALRDLCERYSPGYKFKGKVKLEPGKNGKPPRLIISDQDAGQVMAWMVIGLLERYIFATYTKRSIKNMSKKTRMKKLAEDFHLDKHGQSGEFVERVLACILENDGSAWDACMRARLRKLVEEPFIEAATQMVSEYIVPASMYAEEHLQSTKGKTLTLRFPVGMRDLRHNDPENAELEPGVTLYDYYALRKDVRIKIDAIRRSGHRGTSILNWIANHILWVWVLFGGKGVVFSHEEKKRCIDIFGADRRVLFCFEGDDSILVCSGSFTDDQIAQLSARWTALGHRPKLYLRRAGEAAEFCGWKFLVDGHGLVPGGETVDVPRQFRNGHTCIAPEAVTAVLRGNRKAFAKIAVPGMLTRAYTLADNAPSLAQYFLNMAEYFNGGTVTDANFSSRELYKLGELAADLPEMWRLDEHEFRKLEDTADMRSQIEKVYESVALGKIRCTDEAGFAMAHGWVDNAEEYHTFIELLNAAGFSQLNTLEPADCPGKFGGD
jgi:hypothetical protein